MGWWLEESVAVEWGVVLNDREKNNKRSLAAPNRAVCRMQFQNSTEKVQNDVYCMQNLV